MSLVITNCQRAHCSTLHYLVSFLYIRKPTLDYKNNNKCYCILIRAGPKSRNTCVICVSLLETYIGLVRRRIMSSLFWNNKEGSPRALRHSRVHHWHVFITEGTWYVANPLQGPITRPQGYWLLYRGRVYRSFSCQRKLKCYFLSYFCRYQN